MKIISEYWKKLNAKSNSLLSEYGHENFKQTVGRVYNDDVGPTEMDTLKILWDNLYTLVPGEVLDAFTEPELGNPSGALCNGRLVSIDLGTSIRDYWLLAQYIDFSKLSRIVEIGGGYGKLPYVIKQLHPDIHYTLCDIEPTLGLAEWYLSQVLPKEGIDYVHPEELTGEAELVIATNCLHEMSREQVCTYFDYADKNAEYLYYSCWKDTTMPGDYIRWEQNDYPVKNSWTKLLEQDYIRKDFFEALYMMGGTCQE